MAILVNGVGNIVTDQFKETFMGLKGRVNALEITFVNKDKSYRKDVIYTDDYDAASEPNITQITLDGATTVAQAYQEGQIPAEAQTSTCSGRWTTVRLLTPSPTRP